MSYQVDLLISTGATDPDRISDFCAAAGVRTINLDLPGSRSPSVVSDNYSGARDLTRVILSRIQTEFGVLEPLYFIGGRLSDNNTAERLRGFREAHAELGLEVPEEQLVIRGYAPEKGRSGARGAGPAAALRNFRQFHHHAGRRGPVDAAQQTRRKIRPALRLLRL